VRNPWRPHKIRMLRFLLPAVLAAAVAGVTASGALGHGARLPDAEIFATNNTAVITDPGDPRLRDPLRTFERKVQRFDQESVLTFDYPERPWDPVDAVEVEVPGMDAQRLRDGLLADAEARERLFGGSVTLDGRLVLIAGLEDLELVKRFVTDIGGDFGAATVRSGHREFVG
jgi:hypothetical protein